MKRHIKIYNSNYYLCGLKSTDHKSVEDAGECMQCGYMTGGLLGMRRGDQKEYLDAIRKLQRREAV